MKTQLEHFKTAILSIDEIEDQNYLVQLFELLNETLIIDTIQGTADKENKSYNGIKKSKRYKKTEVAGQTLIIRGVNKLPF